MRFQGEDATLELEVARYEFPADGGAPGSEDRNWLVLKASYQADGQIIKDTNSCLLTGELQALTAGLKVLAAGVRDEYQSQFSEPWFELFAQRLEEGGYGVDVSFALPNTMEDVDTAEVECILDQAELETMVRELEELCRKFPDRV